MVKVQLKEVTKFYGNRRGVENINLLIEDGEYLAVLGATGAGKTTTMYLLAGLLTPSSGSIIFDEKDISKLPAEDRGIGFVFEEYNLFPRMLVEDNVLFGPLVKNLDREESKHVAKELFTLLNISGKEKNFPDEISGGQKQRVALARAIVSNAKLLVMDDPLRALDAKIREVLQVELHKLVKDLGLTCIHATHDTHEAMRVADRIAVFKDGKILQIGTPEEIYNKPNCLYVADFLGENTTLEGRIKKKKEDSYFITSSGLEFKIITDLKDGEEAIALIPSELLDIFSVEEKTSIKYDNIFEGTIHSSKCVGEFNEVQIILNDIIFRAKDLIGKKIPLKKGSKVLVATDKDDYRIFAKEKEIEK